MNIPFPNTESKKYFLGVIFIVILSWIFFFIHDDIVETGGYFLPAIFGFILGIVSGLSPHKAFQACFLGFLVLTLIFGIAFLIFHFLLIMGVICALSAIAGAILRRIILREEIGIALKVRHWIIPLVGLLVLADLFSIAGAYYTLFVYHAYNDFFTLFIPFFMGIIAMGVYVGTFSILDYHELKKVALKVSIGAHCLYILIMGLIIIIEWSHNIFSLNVLFNFIMEFFLMGGFLFALLMGIKIGFYLRSNKLAESYHEKRRSVK